ncbi:hypothetical protein HYC85_027638 [Camellia sinensis]|uniref:Uncharacterized protein n=1 Tax=Camellia sinensis TaxID=4442 RepID=A0A7J7G6Y9_CAMSI|nr:hypothetical protein HYC85_027638 [Camellia sinensis]
MASSDGVKEPHSFVSHSVGFPSAALIPVVKELLRNLMCMRSVRLLSPLPYHKEESALSLLSLYFSVIVFIIHILVSSSSSSCFWFFASVIVCNTFFFLLLFIHPLSSSDSSSLFLSSPTLPVGLCGAKS